MVITGNLKLETRNLEKAWEENSDFKFPVSLKELK